MTPEFMLITFVLFFAGAIAVPIASRLGLGSVLGYLIAGIIILVVKSHYTEIFIMNHFALQTQWDLHHSARHECPGLKSYSRLKCFGCSSSGLSSEVVV